MRLRPYSQPLRQRGGRHLSDASTGEIAIHDNAQNTQGNSLRHRQSQDPTISFLGKFRWVISPLVSVECSPSLCPDHSASLALSPFLSSLDEHQSSFSSPLRLCPLFLLITVVDPCRHNKNIERTEDGREGGEGGEGGGEGRDQEDPTT